MAGILGTQSKSIVVRGSSFAVLAWCRPTVVSKINGGRHCLYPCHLFFTAFSRLNRH
jgi:hypothetical protein